MPRMRKYLCKCGHRRKVVFNWHDGDDYWRNLYCAKCDKHEYSCERIEELTDSARFARAQKNERFRSKTPRSNLRRKLAIVAKQESQETGIDVNIIRERLGLPPLNPNMRRTRK